MLRKPLTTFKDFSEAKQNFNQIPIVHVSDASSYFALLQCNLIEHPIVDIWEDLDTLKFLSAWGIPFPSYVKSLGSYTITIQTLFMEGQSRHSMFTTRQ